MTGNLTEGSGSFKIDHPLDPANKFLSHSFVESLDMMDVYNGNVTTDKRKTSKPGVKVSWQVTGIRHDAYANSHRIPGGRTKVRAGARQVSPS